MCQHREPGHTTEGFLVWETHPIPSLGFPESPGECCRQGRAVSSPRVVLTSPVKLRQLCKPWASELGCNQLQSSARPRCTPRAPRSCRTKDFFQHPRKTMKNNLQLIQSPPWLPPTIPAWECLPGASWKRKARAAEQAVQELGMDLGSFWDPAFGGSTQTFPGNSLGLQALVSSPLLGQSFALLHCSEFYFCPINPWQNKAQPAPSRAG